MSKIISTVSAAVVAFVISASTANAHIVPWRAGESRQLGWGHCAKGACMKRYVWSESKPHRHIGNKVVYVKIASPSRRDEVW